jgi:hypothetical protein
MTTQEYKMIKEDMERLRDEVMGRVRIVRKIRAFFASPVSSAAFVVVCVLSASIFVSFADVLHNIMAQTEWGSRFSYTYLSLVHARILVQVLAVLTSISGLALLAKILFRLRTPVYFIGNFITERTPFKFFRS